MADRSTVSLSIPKNSRVEYILNYLYNKPGHGESVSKILQQNNIVFDDTNSKIICEKLDQLNYFDIENYASKYGYDSGLAPNATGYEFFREYESYSNYLATRKKEEKRAKRITERGAYGSYWSGIGSMIAIPLSLASLGFSVYSYYQTSKQTGINQATTDSLKSIKTEVKSLSKSTYRPLKSLVKKDSLINLRTK